MHIHIFMLYICSNQKYKKDEVIFTHTKKSYCYAHGAYGDMESYNLPQQNHFDYITF